MSRLGKQKRRYDPQAKRRFGRLRSYGSKAERGLSGKYGWLLGGILALAAGVYQGYVDSKAWFPQAAWENYSKKIYGGKTAAGTQYIPEISHLWAKDPNLSAKWTPLTWLAYKFTGYNPDTKSFQGSAWVLPFWASIAGVVGSMLPLGARAKRYQKPLKAIAGGAAIISAIGALTLPGTDVGAVVNATQRQTQSNVPSLGTSSSAQAAEAYLRAGNQATGGTRRFLIAV